MLIFPGCTFCQVLHSDSLTWKSDGMGPWKSKHLRKRVVSTNLNSHGGFLTTSYNHFSEWESIKG